jgi:hypothetical protein
MPRKSLSARGGTAISELMGLFARLEAALTRLEQQRAAASRSAVDAAMAHAADRERLARLEGAASEALKALDALIGQE